MNRFGAMIGALVWRHSDGRYLLLKRSDQKDFAAGQWECVTGRVEHGESFSDGLRREVLEELGLDVQIEMILGAAHFYRGPAAPEQEMLGMYFGCSIAAAEIQLSVEHAASKWVTAREAQELLPPGHWLGELIRRAEVMRRLLPKPLQEFHRANGFEI